MAQPAAGPAGTTPASAPAGGDLDTQAAQAIRRGLDCLYAAAQADGSWSNKYIRQHPGGAAALVLLTALSAGENVAKPPLSTALKYIDGLEPKTVYVRAVRAMVYARLPHGEYGPRLDDDVAWLCANQHRTGGWGYGPGYRTTVENPNWTDISNTFLAMLALRSADEAGAEVPKAVWARCRTYWSNATNSDGGISYQPPGGLGFRLRGSSYGSMTAAGITALFILADKYAAVDEAPYANSAERRANVSPYQRPIARALKWLGDNYPLGDNPKWVWGAGEAYEYYYLFVLQHVADEAGLRRIGKDDFVRAAVRLLIASQRKDGSWIDPGLAAGATDDGKLTVIRTCFALLALIRARSAIFLQKLDLEGDAGNDARDAANLTRWLGQSLKEPATWRLLSPADDAQAFSEAPLLYIQSGLKDYPPEVGGKIRSFVHDGGTVLVQPFGGSAALAQAAKEYFVKLLPDFAAAPVPDSHPIYSLHFKVGLADRPKLFGLGDGCGTRVFIAASDLSGAWHQSRGDSVPQAFQVVANLLLYATDLARPAGKLVARGPEAKPIKAPRYLSVARVKHGGDWDLCPRAMERLSDVLAEALSLGVKETEAEDLSKPVSRNISLLWMTGTRGGRLSPVQQARLRDYLAGGGTLFVDSAMGGEAFHKDAAQSLAEMFGPAAVEPLPLDSPILTGSFGGGVGGAITQVAYSRVVAADQPALKQPSLACVKVDGRVVAILSPYSVTCPLQGKTTYGCKGLATPDARRLAANVALYAAWRQAEAGGGP